MLEIALFLVLFFLFLRFFGMIILGDFMYKELYKKIEKATYIYIYRHIASDYDALGSQFGLKQLIIDNFEDKQVLCMGEKNENLFNQMGINEEEISFEKHNNSLAIVLDTANISRIDGEGYDKCDDFVKIDHHIVVESYGNLNIEDPNASSASELVVRFYEANHHCLQLSKKAAGLLFYGIVGDTNRFMYEGSTASTMRHVATLLETGINKEAIYRSMYVKGIKDLEIQKYLLNHYVYDEGIAYYILHQEDLDTLNITREQGSNYIHVLSNIEEIKVWLAITYQKEKENYRVSLRSRTIPVQPTAAKFNGGGHIYASGATLNSLDQLSEMLEMLKEEISHEI